jgi:hypothetical protein
MPNFDEFSGFETSGPEEAAAPIAEYPPKLHGPWFFETDKLRLEVDSPDGVVSSIDKYGTIIVRTSGITIKASLAASAIGN